MSTFRPGAKNSDALDRVKWAIRNIRAAEDHFRAVNADPTTSTQQCEQARAAREGAVNDFKHQWENVEILLYPDGTK